MDIEELLVVLALLLLAGVLVAPILAIVSLVRTGRLARRLDALEQQRHPIGPGAVPTRAPGAAIAPAVATEAGPPPPPIPEQASSELRDANLYAPVRVADAGAVPPPPPPPPPAAPEEDWESRIGVRIAAWVGMGLVLLGAAFFITYAIQRQWLGPGMRVMLGILFGAALVVAGHVLERRAYPRLSRAFTAGGAALLYFSVYAARGIYGMIGPLPAFAGLAGISLAVLALAALYNSPVIALGALLGAFFVPPLTSSGTRDGIFFLSYIAMLNIPVMGLGLKRRWQALYNTDTVLTWLAYAFAVLDGLHGLGDEDGGTRLLFAGIFFAQFVVLHLLKLWREEARRRPWDLARLSFNSIAALAALHFTLTEADWEAWIGLALLGGAGVHLLLAVIARKRLPRFTDDALAFLLVAATFVALALPLQLDGVWVSAGWVAEGLLLAWFGMRLHAPLLRIAGSAVTLLGLGKSQLYDFELYDTPPRLFLNGRLLTGLFAAGAFALQSRWQPAPARGDDATPAAFPAAAVLAVGGLVVAAVALMLDCFFTLQADPLSAAALGTLLVAALAAVTLRLVTDRDDGVAGALAIAAWALLGLVALKVMLYDLWNLAEAARDLYAPFRNGPLWGLLAAAALTAGAMGGTRGRRAAALHILAAVATVAVLTAEFSRIDGPWRNAAITLLWAGAAMASIGVGLALRRRHLRWFGFVLFGLSAVKAVLVDLAGLRGLPRIAAFLGAGALWLVLSFVYQRLARAQAAATPPPSGDAP
jgi:uncharacterized membrane protein